MIKKNLSTNKKTVEVNSRTYGKHTRSARGSQSIVVLNEAFAKQASKTGAVNKAAIAAYSFLKAEFPGFKEGQLWQNILSRMRKAGNVDFASLLESLGGLELNSRYPLKRFTMPWLVTEVQENDVVAALHLNMKPALNKKDNCYRFLLMVLFFDAACAFTGHQQGLSGWYYAKDEKPDVIPFNFSKPMHAHHCLFCLQLECGVDGNATGNLSSRGVRLMGYEGL